MKAKPTEVGRVVCVKQGHDAGNWCAVLRIESEHTVWLVDGLTRTLAKPKKKNEKHLFATPYTISVEGKGAGGGCMLDSDIRSALKAAQDACKKDGSQAHASQQKEECAFVQE